MVNIEVNIDEGAEGYKASTLTIEGFTVGLVKPLDVHELTPVLKRIEELGEFVNFKCIMFTGTGKDRSRGVLPWTVNMIEEKFSKFPNTRKFLWMLSESRFPVRIDTVYDTLVVGDSCPEWHEGGKK